MPGRPNRNQPAGAIGAAGEAASSAPVRVLNQGQLSLALHDNFGGCAPQAEWSASLRPSDQQEHASANWECTDEACLTLRRATGRRSRLRYLPDR
jgi:hypothetical protein